MAKKQAPTFYLFYGDDDVGMAEQVQKMRTELGDDFNTNEFDGAHATVPEILNAVSSMPFLGDKRLCIVKGLVNHLTKRGAGNKKALERLLDELPKLPPHARLVLVEPGNLKKNSKIVQLAQEKGLCKAFSTPKDATQWTMQRAKSAYSAEIDERAARALASVTENDLRRIDNELIKLVSYVDGERPIGEHDVALLTPYVADANIFAVVDALAVGDGHQALTLMHQVLVQDPSDPGFRLLTLITRQFRLLLLTREHLDGGGSTRGNDVADAIGLRSAWQAEKLTQQARAFDIDPLEKIYRRLQQYDFDIKTGRIQPGLALDLLVASLAKS